jgi:hypothetical protein
LKEKDVCTIYGMRNITKISVINPSDSLSVLPFTMLLLAFSVDINTTAMLFALVPGANIFATVRPFESAIALLHIINVVSDIATTVRPSEGSIALHLVIPPFTREYSAICPLINTGTMDVIIVKVAGVSAVVGPCEFSLAVLLSLKVLTLI